MMKNSYPILLFFFLFGLAACQQATDQSSKQAPPPPKAESAEQWTALFDGQSTEGWRAFNGDTLPDGWIVEEQCLKSLGKGGDIGGDIVYGAQEFENFDLRMEWKISTGGNSGIFYHVQEGEQYQAAYQNAPEYQVLDDIGFPEPLQDWQQLGADYAMYSADIERKIVKPAGEWNSSRIVFTPQKVEHWLNGEKIVAFVPWSADWKQRRQAGKWKDFPDYGMAKKGLIGLQDHGSFIWYRNIRIKEL
ncbi:MAG: DUF1080 domain-containing protein [Bacteroidota bacterium]